MGQPGSTQRPPGHSGGLLVTGGTKLKTIDGHAVFCVSTQPKQAKTTAVNSWNAQQELAMIAQELKSMVSEIESIELETSLNVDVNPLPTDLTQKKSKKRSKLQFGKFNASNYFGRSFATSTTKEKDQDKDKDKDQNKHKVKALMKWYVVFCFIFFGFTFILLFIVAFVSH